MYRKNLIWQQIQAFLPEKNRLSDKNMPSEVIIEYMDNKIRYDEYCSPTPSSITVIIFHGVGGNGRLLSFIAVPLVEAGFNVICPDLPGYGYTKFETLFDYDSWVETGAFIAENEIKRGREIFIFGLSAGGMLAYNVTCKIKKVKGLIITNILDNRLQKVRDYSAKNKFQSRIGIRLLNKLPSIVGKIKIPISFVSNMTSIVNNKSVLNLLLRDKSGAGGSVSIKFLLSMMNSAPLLEPEEFDICPVILAHPEIDRWTPVEISRYFFDRIKSEKKLIILNNAGHFPIESPGLQQLEDACIKFISGSFNLHASEGLSHRQKYPL